MNILHLAVIIAVFSSTFFQITNGTRTNKKNLSNQFPKVNFKYLLNFGFWGKVLCHLFEDERVLGNYITYIDYKLKSSLGTKNAQAVIHSIFEDYNTLLVIYFKLPKLLKRVSNIKARNTGKEFGDAIRILINFGNDHTIARNIYKQIRKYKGNNGSRGIGKLIDILKESETEKEHKKLETGWKGTNSDHSMDTISKLVQLINTICPAVTKQLMGKLPSTYGRKINKTFKTDFKIDFNVRNRLSDTEIIDKLYDIKNKVHKLCPRNIFVITEIITEILERIKLIKNVENENYKLTSKPSNVGNEIHKLTNKVPNVRHESHKLTNKMPNVGNESHKLPSKPSFEAINEKTPYDIPRILSASVNSTATIIPGYSKLENHMLKNSSKMSSRELNKRKSNMVINKEIMVDEETAGFSDLSFKLQMDSLMSVDDFLKDTSNKSFIGNKMPYYNPFAPRVNAPSKHKFSGNLASSSLYFGEQLQNTEAFTQIISELSSSELLNVMNNNTRDSEIIDSNISLVNSGYEDPPEKGIQWARRKRNKKV